MIEDLGLLCNICVNTKCTVMLECKHIYCINCYNIIINDKNLCSYCRQYINRNNTQLH